MRVIQTRRFALAIADARAELASWSMVDCLGWLRRNDPNGEWASYLGDYSRAVDERGDLSIDDARDVVWSQMQDC